MANEQQLRQIFQQVDADRSGQISANELQKALSNGTWTPFSIDTVNLMIGLFDRQRNGTIDFGEFQSLWNFITGWQNTFRHYDRDNSGAIDVNELKTALNAFGYRLSDHFYQAVVPKFDRGRRGQILFDDFIQLCVTLQLLTSQFRAADTHGAGTASITYEHFLVMASTLISYKH